MLRFSSLLLLVSLGSTSRADPPPDGGREVAYSFEIENLDHFPDYLIVAYPFNCQARGPIYPDPQALRLPPAQLRRPDYEVLRPGKTYVISKECPLGALYALPAREFAKRVVDAAGRPGPREKGEKVTVISYLEGRTLPERSHFFGKDRWVFPTGYRLRPLLSLGGLAEVVRVHDVIRLDVGDQGRPAARGHRVVFTYRDGGVEERTYRSALRPRPLRPNALAGLDDERGWEPASDEPPRPVAAPPLRREPAPAGTPLLPRRIVEVTPAGVALYIAIVAMLLTGAIMASMRRT